MDEKLRQKLEKLERAVADLEKSTKTSLGFVETIEYKGIEFNVSRRFVIAELSPLAFFHLVEHIEGDAASAVVRLFDRLVPLLECRHQWTPLRRQSDDPVRKLALVGDSQPHVCKSCTAYALGPELPVVGRKLA